MSGFIITAIATLIIFGAVGLGMLVVFAGLLALEWTIYRLSPCAAPVRDDTPYWRVHGGGIERPRKAQPFEHLAP